MRVKCVKDEGWNKNNQNFNVASNILGKNYYRSQKSE